MNCEGFQGQCAGVGEFELTDAECEHLDDCLLCEGAFLEACERWRAAPDGISDPARELEMAYIEEGVTALMRRAVPIEYWGVVHQRAEMRKLLN